MSIELRSVGDRVNSQSLEVQRGSAKNGLQCTVLQLENASKAIIREVSDPNAWPSSHGFMTFKTP